jgi:hypothetical protein
MSKIFQIEAVIATDSDDVRGTVIIGADSALEAEKVALRQIPGTKSATVLKELTHSLLQMQYETVPQAAALR